MRMERTQKDVSMLEVLIPASKNSVVGNRVALCCPFVGQALPSVNLPALSRDMLVQEGYVGNMRYERGFTLIELLITMVVASILLALAVPAFQSFIQNNRITSQTNELVTTLATARSEAIKRKQGVTVCSSSDGSTCTGSWNQGWIVFADSGFDGTVDAGDTVLRVWGPLAGGSTIVTNPAGTTSTSFDRLGGASNNVTFQLRILNCEGDKARDLTLRTSGSVQTTPQSCS